MCGGEAVDELGCQCQPEHVLVAGQLVAAVRQALADRRIREGGELDADLSSARVERPLHLRECLLPDRAVEPESYRLVERLARSGEDGDAAADVMDQHVGAA